MQENLYDAIVNVYQRTLNEIKQETTIKELKEFAIKVLVWELVRLNILIGSE